MTDDVMPAGEVWWIYSDRPEPWAGLRMAHFSKAMPDSTDVFFILGDIRYRTGIRIWSEVAPREGWHKIRQITVPTPGEIVERIGKS